MKEDVQILNDILGKSRRIVASFTVNRCMQFLIGLMKRFGYTTETFFVPLEQKSTSKPLRPRT
jgi:hypothetical protein